VWGEEGHGRVSAGERAQPAASHQPAAAEGRCPQTLLRAPALCTHSPTHSGLVGGVGGGDGVLVDAKEKGKATQPHEQALQRAHVRRVQVQGSLWRHAVIPDQLILLWQGAVGQGQALQGGLKGVVVPAPATHGARWRTGAQELGQG
jgi:hypothetical protein